MRPAINRKSKEGPRRPLGYNAFWTVLERARWESDRTNQPLSVIVARAESTSELWHDRRLRAQTIAELSKLFFEKAPRPDAVGWVGRHALALMLPNVSASEAWRTTEQFRDRLRTLPDGLTLAEDIRFYVYHTVPEAPADSQQWGAKGPPEGQHVSPQESTSLPLDHLLIRPLPAWKRMMDILGAVVGLLVFWPVMAVTAIAIKLSSPGPAVFKQIRLGLGGRPFVFYKFRTMMADAEAMKPTLARAACAPTPTFKMFNDPRVTPVGRILRRWSIDELPQLWNVLKGDMSLVGPRPLPAEEPHPDSAWYRRRLEVTPGLTCIWQVSGRSALPLEKWMEMDIRYIQERSFWTDLKILCLTIPAVLSRRGAW